MKHTLKSLLITTTLTLPSVFGAAAVLEAENDYISFAAKPSASIGYKAAKPTISAASSQSNGSAKPESDSTTQSKSSAYAPADSTPSAAASSEFYHTKLHTEQLSTTTAISSAEPSGKFKPGQLDVEEFPTTETPLPNAAASSQSQPVQLHNEQLSTTAVLSRAEPSGEFKPDQLDVVEFPTTETALPNAVASSRFFELDQPQDENWSQSTALIPSDIAMAASQEAAVPKLSGKPISDLVVKTIAGYFEDSNGLARVSKVWSSKVPSLNQTYLDLHHMNVLIKLLNRLNEQSKYDSESMGLRELFSQDSQDIPDDKALVLVVEDPNSISFDHLLKIALILKPWNMKISPADLNTILNSIDRITRFTAAEKTIFTMLFSNPTPSDFIQAADKLSQLEMTYNDKAASLYKLAANHRTATSEDILDAARGFYKLGPDYYDSAASLYELAADHKDATAELIREAAAYGLVQLGSAYHGRAASLYVRAARHKDASPWDIQQAANRLGQLGTAYHPIAASLYKLAADHKDATPWDIKQAANRLGQLGTAYHPIAASLYKLAADHKDATPLDIQQAANGLGQLGPEYNDIAALLYEILATHREADNWNISVAADGLKDLGFYDRAKKLRKKLEPSK